MSYRKKVSVELTFRPKTRVLMATGEQLSDTFLNVHIKVCSQVVVGPAAWRKK